MHFDIQEYVESNLDRAKEVASDKGGQEYTATCPWCGKYGSFYVNVASGAFVCFKCDSRGKSAVWLVAEVEGIDSSEARAYIFRQSVELRRKDTLFSLGDRVRSLRPHADRVEEEDDRVEVELPDKFVPIYKGGKWRLPGYLKQRKIRSETARAWGLGYCNGGKYSDRLIIPIICPNGYSFTSRAMSSKHEPKYLNPPNADHRRLLIGWNVAKLTGDFAIVEGPLDSVRMWQNEVSALALGGKVIHDEQLGMLMELDPESAITVMLDPEEKVAPLEVAARLSSHFKNIYIANLPSGVDPGSATRKQTHRAIDNAPRWTGDRSSRLKARLSSSRSGMVKRYR